MLLMRSILCLLALVCTAMTAAQTPLRCISYNVENLFDYQHDTLRQDHDYTPDGHLQWSPARYHAKLDKIAQVLVNASGWQSTPLVGLCEVENVRCLRDLCKRLRCFHYTYVHYESLDERGVDVALLYDSLRVRVLHSQALRVDLQGDYTRDILYVCAEYEARDTIHVMVCHLPSQLGGSDASDWKRKAAKAVLQAHVDSLCSSEQRPKIIVMGDMNTAPADDLRHLANLTVNMPRNQGTHKYAGEWEYLDQYYVSAYWRDSAQVEVFAPAWMMEEDEKHLGTCPKRTYAGMRYMGGYSDHLPLLLRLKW